jgi:cysteine desulfurase
MTKAYLDNVAGTRPSTEVVEAMVPYMRDFYGNPQSMHTWGDEAREGVERARSQVADLIGALPEEIIFTASGTEANNLAIKGLARGNESKGKHIVLSAIEHFSVMHAAKRLQKAGYEVTLIPVNEYGVVDTEQLAKAIREETVLVSIMHANSEVGTIQPIAELAKIVKKAGALFHTDAVATAGTIPLKVTELGVDALSLAGNQFYGPKGAAALWVKKGVRVLPLLEGGIQEGGRRPGTEDVPAIVGMGKAAELAAQEMESRSARVKALRDKLIEGVLSRVDHSILTGHPTERVPGSASFCIQFIEGEAMLMLLSHHGIAASSGSACTSKALKASHVLTAMGIPAEIAQGSLLFGLGAETTEEEIDLVLETLPPVVDRLRQMSPLYSKFLKEQKGEVSHANL